MPMGWAAGPAPEEPRGIRAPDDAASPGDGGLGVLLLCRQREEVRCGFSLSVTLISQPLPQLSSSRRGRRRLPGSGVGLEAETLTLPRGSRAGRLRGLGAAAAEWFLPTKRVSFIAK